MGQANKYETPVRQSSELTKACTAVVTQILDKGLEDLSPEDIKSLDVLKLAIEQKLSTFQVTPESPIQ